MSDKWLTEWLRDGSVRLTDFASEPPRQAVVAASLSRAEKEAAIAAFFGPYVRVERNDFISYTPREYGVAIITSIVTELRREGIFTTNAQATRVRDAIIAGAIEILKK